MEEDILTMEEDWREVIGGDSGAIQLSEREVQQQTAIWELLSTEAAYIKTLKVVTDLFLACLLSLQSSPRILTEVDTEQLFSNIQEIYAANFSFWKQYLLPMVEDARKRSRMWNQTLTPKVPPSLLEPKLMIDGFLKFGEMFHPYTKYCMDQSHCQKYCREKIHENELFTAYLAWCETRKECNRLRLQDIVVKPMQRLTKYSLLLKAIQRHTENTVDVESLDQMIKAVDEFVNGVNTTLKQRQDQEKLRGIIARIESYDVVETKDDEMEKLVKNYSELKLTCPMPGCNPGHQRHLLMEADLRLRDHATSKTEAHIFLFTDMLLVCKHVTKKSSGAGGGANIGAAVGTLGPSGVMGPGGVGGSVTGAGGAGSDRMLKVIRQPFIVDRLIVKDTPSGNGLSMVYLNEFNVATAAFTLSASEPKVIKGLNDSILKAREQYKKAKNKSRDEEAEEAVNNALAANAVSPFPRSPKLSAISPFDSTNSSYCLCFYEDGGAGMNSSMLGGTGETSLAGGLIPSCPRSPRCSSSRGSRVSSLAHSHSGSMEMNEVSSGGASTCYSRGVSVETMTDLRGSSLSSDEGSAAAAALSDSGVGPSQLPPPSPPPPSTSTSTPSLHQIHSVPPASPRPERRAVLSRSPTPNTLSVQAPYVSSMASTSLSSMGGHSGRTCLGGQSLPNLSSMLTGGRAGNASAPSPPNTSQHHHHHSPSTMLLVPPSRSPPPIGVNQRGISYPPPSPPRSLRRSYAVVAGQPSRNPPLTKTRHVGSLGPSVHSSFSCSTGGMEYSTDGTGATESSEVKMGEKGCDDKSEVNLDLKVPTIGGVLPPSKSMTNVLSQETEDVRIGSGTGEPSLVREAGHRSVGAELDVGRPLAREASWSAFDTLAPGYQMPLKSPREPAKKPCQGSERQDDKCQYNTAVTIDDIKREDATNKWASWDCGSQRQGQEPCPTQDDPPRFQAELKKSSFPQYSHGSLEAAQCSSGSSRVRISGVQHPGAASDGKERLEDLKRDSAAFETVTTEMWDTSSRCLASTMEGRGGKVLNPDPYGEMPFDTSPRRQERQAVKPDVWANDALRNRLPPTEAINEELLRGAQSNLVTSSGANLPENFSSSELRAESGPSSSVPPSRSSKADLLRMKDFILTEASIESSDI